MKLVKTILVVIFFMFLISVFMLNKNVELQIKYFGLSKPVTVQFWELVTVCVALGVIVSALWDFFSELKWMRERRKMIQTHREHKSVEGRLTARIEELEAENLGLQHELEGLQRTGGAPGKSPVGTTPVDSRDKASRVAAPASGTSKDKTAPLSAGSDLPAAAESATAAGISGQQGGPARGGVLAGPVTGAGPKGSVLPGAAGGKSAGVGPDASGQPEPVKKVGFLARFGRGISKAAPKDPDLSPKPPQAGPSTAKPSGAAIEIQDPTAAKKSGVFAGAGKDLDKKDAPAAAATGTPPMRADLAKPASSGTITLSGTELKPGLSADEKPPDQSKGEKESK